MKIGDPPKTRRSRAITAPLSAKRAEGNAPAAGPADHVEFLGIPDAELTPRVREALIGLMAELSKLRQELATARQQIGELQKLAETDPHLNILNRRAFVRELNRAFGMLERYEVKACLVFIDVNDLKKINDESGHAAGDQALAHTVDSIVANVRQTDIVARLGGDEFAVLLYHVDSETAQRKAEELSSIVSSRPVVVNDIEFVVSVSFGVVELRKGANVEAAMRLADEAMYRDKKNKPKR